MIVAINNFRVKIDNINSYLLVIFGFLLPITVAGANIFAGLIFILWLIKADFLNDFNRLKNNKVIQAVLLFILLHIIGLAWTQDMQWGLHILKKELIFLFLPIFMLFVKKDHIKFYISSFLLAMTLSELISYGIWFEMIPPFKYAQVYNPTPFMSHISYNPFLAIAIYLLAYYVLFDFNLNKKQKMIYIFFIITMSINMFITGGRAGQVMFFISIFILILQYFKSFSIKSISIATFAICTLIILTYSSSEIFNKRVNLAINEFINYDKNANESSVGYRLTYAINSFEIIKRNYLIGVGTGDFKDEYLKEHIKYNTIVPTTVNPHNMYLLEIVQFGIFGLLSLCYMLYTQIVTSKKSTLDIGKKVGLALPIMFGIIMLSDSYLLGHFTTMLFIFLSAILYKDYETN